MAKRWVEKINEIRALLDELEEGLTGEGSGSSPEKQVEIGEEEEEEAVRPARPGRGGMGSVMVVLHGNKGKGLFGRGKKE